MDADSTFAKKSCMTEKRKPGRPAKPADQKTKPHTIRLTAAERELMLKAGMAEFRKWLQGTAKA